MSHSFVQISHHKIKLHFVFIDLKKKAIIQTMFPSFFIGNKSEVCGTNMRGATFVLHTIHNIKKTYLAPEWYQFSRIYSYECLLIRWRTRTQKKLHIL